MAGHRHGNKPDKEDCGAERGSRHPWSAPEAGPGSGNFGSLSGAFSRSGPRGGGSASVQGGAGGHRLGRRCPPRVPHTKDVAFALLGETAHHAAIRGLPFFHATAFLAELPRQIKAAALKFRGRCGHRDAGRRTPGAASRILKGQRELALPAALLALLSEIRTSPFLTRGRGRWGARAGEQPPRPLAWRVLSPFM